MLSSLLNLTIVHLTLRNVFKSPFLSFNTAIQLSLSQSQIYRITNPFLFNAYGQIKIFDSTFNRALNEIFSIGRSTILSYCINETSKQFKETYPINPNCYAFFGCCSFINVSTAIKSDADSYSTVKIKSCSFTGSKDEVRLISLPGNEQLIIEDSYFIIEDPNFSPKPKGVFIYSDSETQLANSPNFHSFFQLKRTFLGFDGASSKQTTRDSIAARAIYHDITDINMTEIKLSDTKWGCCLGLQAEAMIKIEHSKFNYNEGGNLIWIWNLPDKRHQKISDNCFIGNNVTSLFYINKDIYIENCFLQSDDFTNTVLYRRYNKDSSYIGDNNNELHSYGTLVFDTDQLNSENCQISDPTSTPTPGPSTTPPPSTIPPASATPIKNVTTQPPSPTSPSASVSCSQSPPRTPWPATSPMPTYTPTATPPYLPIFGITFAVVFALCLIIFIIVFCCREFHHKSSEDTVGDNAAANLSGVGERSYSSETDPLNLNTSSDDSFLM